MAIHAIERREALQNGPSSVRRVVVLVSVNTAVFGGMGAVVGFGLAGPMGAVAGAVVGVAVGLIFTMASILADYRDNCTKDRRVYEEIAKKMQKRDINPFDVEVLFGRRASQRLDLNLIIKFIIPFIVDRDLIASLGDGGSDAQSKAMRLLVIAVKRFIEREISLEERAKIQTAWNGFRGDLFERAV
jgi:hypothetical protein